MKYGFNDFLIASGYKGKVIKHYFQNKKIKGSKIKVINTGLKTLTGGRLKRLKKYIKSNFFLTYGDGISNVNLKKLLNFHKKNKKIVTVTAVKPMARFGELKIKKNIVTSFKEKPQTSVGWINGGFFVMEKKFLNSIKGDKTILEKEPLENISKKKQLAAYKHSGFWYCMDTKRDKDVLEKLLKKKE